MQKITMLRKEMLLLKIFFFFNLFFSFTQSNAQTLKTDAVVPVLDVCDQARQFSVNIAKGSSACTNGKLKIEVPDGFELQKGSVKVDNQPVVENYRSAKEMIVNVNIPSGPITQEINVTFYAKALCSIIGNNSSVPVVNYSIEGCTNEVKDASSDPINIRYAVLRIAVSPDGFLGKVNDEVSRTIKVVNQGNGDISSFTVERNLGNGLLFLSYDFSDLIAQGWEVNFTSDNAIVFSGKTLKSAESISFTEKVKIESCVLTPTRYQVYYGCTEKCTINNVNGSTTNIINLVVGNAPKLEVKSIGLDLNCFNSLGRNTWRITNTGNVATQEIKFEISALEDIDISNGSIRVGNTPVNVLLGSSSKNAIVALPALQPGQSIEISFNQYYKATNATPETCAMAPDFFATGQNSYSATFGFDGACADVTNSGSVKEDSRYDFAGQHVGEVDIFKGENFSIDYLFHSFSIANEQLKAGDKFAITVELSAGLNVSDLKFKGVDAISLGDNKYEIVFTYGTEPWKLNEKLSYAFSRLQFPLELDCDVADLSNLWYKIGGELRKQGNCEPVVFKCNTTKLIGFCEGGPCSNALENDKANLKRINIGHSVDQDGKPNVAIVSANAELRNFIAGDILEISQISKANIANKDFNTVRFVVTKNATFETSLVLNSGKVFSNGVLVAQNLVVSQTSTSYILEYTLPNTIQNNQTFVLSLQLKAGKSDEFGLKRFPTKSFLVDASGEAFYCKEPYTATGIFIPTKFEFNGNDTNFVLCENKDNTAKFSAKLLDFDFQDSFFTKEYRKLFAPKTATLSVPENLVLTGVTVTVKNQNWLKNNTSTTITGLNVTDADYVLDVANVVKAITALTLGANNGIDYLDEGYVIEITPIVSLVGCEPKVNSEKKSISVAFNGVVVDGQNPETVFNKSANLEYNTGIGTLTMKVSNDHNFGRFNEDATEVSWVVKVESEGNRDFNSVWFAKDGGNLLITSVSEVTNYLGTNVLRPINSVNGIYQLGNHSAKEAKFYLVKSSVIDCAVEELDLIGGYNCAVNTYPTSIATAPCTIETLTLTHDEIRNIIQTEIYEQFNGVDTKPNLCEDIWYTVQVHNGGDSKLKNIEVSIPLNTAPGLVFDKLEYGTVYHTLNSVPTTYTTGVNNTDYKVENNILKISLPASITLNTLERVRIKVHFKVAACDFRSGSKHTVFTKALNTCGAVVTEQSNPSTRRLIIQGGSDSFPEVRKVDGSHSLVIDPVLTSGEVLRSVFNTSIINSGEFGVNDAITNEYQIAIKLPENWSIVGNPADYITPVGKITYSSYSDERGYVYNVTQNINVGEEIKLKNVPLKYTLSNETSLNCDHKFGKIQLLVFQNIPVSACSPLDCSAKGIDQVLYEDFTEIQLPLVSALTISPAFQNPEICNPTVNGGRPTLKDIIFNEATTVYHLDWYENLTEATKDLAVNRLNPNTQLVDGRTYYVVNRFVINGECKSNIGEIKVTFKENNLRGEVVTICENDSQSYRVKVTLNGTGPFTVTGTGAPGNFVNNVWTSNSISASTPFGSVPDYSVTFTDANNCSPLVISGAAPVCCTLEISCPAEKTVNCGSSLLPSVTGLPTIIKSCGLTSMTYTDSDISTCVNGFKSFERTFTITDSKGNVKKCTQIIKIKDDVAPVFNGPLPANTTVSCASAIPAASTLTATDACSVVNVTMVENITNKTCDSKFILTRTWTATDACGNTTVHTQVITVNDDVKPQFVGVLPVNVTVSCLANVPTAPVLTATDNCGSATVDFAEIVSDKICDSKFKLTRTWTATDACGNINVHTQVITVNDDVKPQFVGVLPINVIVSCTANVPTAPVLTATDNCGSATVDFAENVSNKTCDSKYTLTRTWTATDDCGNTNVHTQVITVNDDVKPQFVGALPTNVTVACVADIPVATNLTATDNCGSVTVSFSENVTDKTCDSKFKLTRTWTVTDDCGNTNVHVQVIIVNDNVKPQFVGSIPADLTVSCANDVPAVANLTATDNCGSAVVSHQDVIIKQDGTCNNNYVIKRTYTATDACGNTSSFTQTITVNDNVAPVFVGRLPIDITVSCSAEIPAAETLAATDNCGSSLVRISHNDLLIFENNSCPNNYIVERTYTAIDGCGNRTSHIQKITVKDTIAPRFVQNLPGDIIVSCASEIPNHVTLTAIDNCGSADVTFNEVKINGSCEGNFKLVRTWTAIDTCGNTTVHTQTVNVEDKTAPLFTVEPKSKIVECDGNGNKEEFDAWLNSYAGAVAHDTCSTVKLSYLVEDTNTTCGRSGNIVVTFFATDSCGNFAFKQAVFIIKDTTPPVFIKPAKSITVECGANDDALNAWLATNGGAIAVDSCSSDVTWTNNFTSITKTCGNTGFAEVSFTAIDACGNKSVTVAKFTIVDTKAPTLNTPAQSLTVSCKTNTTEALKNWLNSRGGATATDLCSEVVWTNNFVELTKGCGMNASTEVTFTAKDLCGNEVSTTATFTIEDKDAPVITVHSKNKTVELNADRNTQDLQNWVDANLAIVSATSCSNVTWSHSDLSLTDACGKTGSVEVTFTATDGCGRTATTTATFTIVDTKAPTFTTSPINKEVECDGGGNLTELNEWISKNGNAVVTDFSPEITWSHVTSEGTLVGKVKVYYVDFTATDACGNAATKRGTFTIVDTTAPVISTLAKDKTVECDGNGNTTALNAWLNSFGGAVASDLCGTHTWSHNFTELTKTCGSTGYADITFKAKDAFGNVSTTVARFTIEDTTAPTLITPAQSLTVSCATNTTEALKNWLATRGGATASDSCSGVTWSHNFVELTPGCGSTGSAVVTFTATDACGNKEETTATFVIEDKILPIITIQAKNKTVESDGNGNLLELQAWLNVHASAKATDSCSEITWSNDFIELTKGCGTTGSAEVTFTASDACGNSVHTVATFTIVDTTPPDFMILVQDEIVECDGQGNEAQFNDWLDRKGNAKVREDESQVVWSYSIFSTTVFENKTVHTVDFEAADLCGNKASKRGKFTIHDTVAPEITVVATDKVVECDGNGNTNDLAAWLTSHAGAVAVDLCGPATWSHNFTGLNNACGSTGSAEVTFTATDASGNSSITKATFTIVDTTAPVFESNLPQDLVLECDMEIPKVELVRATDLCGSATVTFKEVINDGSCGNNYQIVRTWTATDSCGNATSHVQTITIQDTTPPEFVGTLPAAEVFMNCKDLKNAEVLKAIDNCGEVTVTSYDEKVDGDCEAKYDIIRTWVATDSCGNSTSFTQTIHLSCAITIYNAVTADGDGLNDEFIIEGLNCYPGNTVEIFNRWGVLVYETKNYNSNGNTFKGYADGRATISKGSKLPTGTYFYVIKYTYDLGNGQASPIEQAGYLHLETN